MLLFLRILCLGSGGDIHGGTILAMRGKDSVLVASDSRFSSYKTGSFMLGEYPRPLFQVGSRTLVCCIGLDSDAHALNEAVKEQLSNHEDTTTIEPESVARVVSNILYRNRLYLTPMVVGIDSSGVPLICSMDGLGAQTLSEAFAVSGTASGGLYAICESEFRPDLCEEELLDTAERALTLALQRDVLSGRRVFMTLLRSDGTRLRKTFSTDDA